MALRSHSQACTARAKVEPPGPAATEASQGPANQAATPTAAPTPAAAASR